MPLPKRGDRVRLLAMPDDPDPVKPGAAGTVTAVRQHQDWAQIDVDWDDGRKLMLAMPPDEVEIIATAPK